MFVIPEMHDELPCVNHAVDHKYACAYADPIIKHLKKGVPEVDEFCITPW